MTAHVPPPEEPLIALLKFGSPYNVLKTKNFENVGLAGWESKFSEDKVSI